MKLKKWLSRALVLAMVVALMIPVPVAAKSSGGGKLVKSVTYYSAQKSGGWRAEEKVSFKYGKKSMPTEVTNTTYYSWFLGVPVAGSSNTETMKYKGKSAKSYDSAGFLTGKTTYKNGKVASYSWERKTSNKVQNVENGPYVDFATFSAGVGHATYFKNGLTKASDYTSSSVDSANRSSTSVSNSVYAWTQKKGVPSAVVATTVRNSVVNGTAYNFDPEYDYAIFNSKGLAIEVGRVVEGKNVPDYAIQYTMKKGKVDTAVVYEIDSKGVPTPSAMMKFAYTKTSVSKTKNFNMINTLVKACEEFDDGEYGFWEFIPGNFNWY